MESGYTATHDNTGSPLSRRLYEAVQDGDAERTTPLAPGLLTSAKADGFHVVTRLEGGWLLGLRLVRRAGRHEVVEAQFLSFQAEGAGLSTGFLRTVPLGQIIDAARAHAAEVAEVISGEAAARLFELLEPWRRDARTSDVTRDETSYAALVARYVELVSRGDRKPADTIGKELGMSAVTVSQRVREARQRGLLTDAPPGKPGGDLTELAYHLLQRVI